MKQTLRKLLVLLLVATMVFSVMAPALATGTSAPVAGGLAAVEATVPEQDWQMDRSFPSGTDDTLVMNSLWSFKSYEDQGEIYVTLNEAVESFRLFVNNVEIDTTAMVAGKSYKVDISTIALNGTNTVQVSNVYPAGVRGLVNVKAAYPVVIEGTPEEVGMDSSTLEAMGDMLKAEAKYGFSGTQVAIIKNGKLVWNEGYGSVNGWNADGTEIQPEDDNYVPVTTDTLYDLASVSKMYTANYAIQYLYEQGMVDLDATIESIFPGFVEDTLWIDYNYTYTGAADLEECKEWKAELTIKDILMHQAGFAADPQFHNNYYDQATQKNTENPEQNVLFSQDRETTLEMILKSPLVYRPGTKTVYSDVDYMLLCFIVEEITGMGFDAYLKEIFWDPMGLTHVTFNPLENGFDVDDCAATELDGNKRCDFEDLATGGEGVIKFVNMRDGVCQGTVHDEKCYYSMGGISGHAGLYANAEDLAKLCTLMLTGGYGDDHYWTTSTMEQFTEAKSLSYTTWGLGWWREGELGRDSYWTCQTSNDTIGHQGWTGTLTMIDPDEELVVVVLGNRKNSPILANEKGANDFYGDNMVMGSISIVNQYVYEAIRSTPDAVDASIYEMANERIRALRSHKGAYDEVAHMADCFALTEAAIVRAEKRGTPESLAYARELVATLKSECALYVTGTYGIGNKDNVANANKWLSEFEARVQKIRVTTNVADPVMTAVEVEDAPGINPETLSYDGSESADQDAVFFPHVRSTGNSTSYAYRNNTTWWDTFEGQGTLYLCVYKPVSSLRVFINGHEVDTSNMLNTTGIFAIDASEYTRNGRNMVQLTDVGYYAPRSILMVVHNAEVIEGTAEEVGVNEAVFEMIDTIVANDVEYGFTSAQLAVVKDGKLIHTNAWGAANSYYSDGTRITEDDPNYVPVTDETLYDLASNSKMYTVNYAMQKLVSEKKIDLSTKIVDLFPEFASSTIFKKGTTDEQKAQIVEWKNALTVQDILQHQAGFDPDPQYHNDQFNQLTQKPEAGCENELYAETRAEAKTMVLASPLVYEPGTKTVYSDVDYMLLCFVIEQVTGMGIDEYLQENFWEPMGLTHVTYNPLENGFTKNDCAATELNGNSRDGAIQFTDNRTGVIQGEVHDEKCYYAMDGISGHAGLFANATDLAKLTQVMQNYNGYGTVRLANHEVNSYFTGRKDNLAQWGQGWWRQGNCQRPWYFGVQAPSTTIGHQGWTGTLTSIDMENNLTTVYLTNKINSPVTDNTTNANKFDGNWYTSSTLGFVPNILYLGMDSHTATDDIQPALDALLIDMSAIKITRYAGAAHVGDLEHPDNLSALALLEAAAEVVAARPTEANIESLRIALKSADRVFTAEDLKDVFKAVEDLNIFTDVVAKKWYFAPVMWAYNFGIVDGMTETEFVPNGTATRGQFVTMLYRFSGEEYVAEKSTFSDVATNRYYYEAIEWAAANGIVNGMSATEFGPELQITREQIVKMLRSYAEYLKLDVSATCELSNPDAANISGWAVKHVKWAVAVGLMEGDENGMLNAKNSATRAEIVTLLERFNSYIIGK